MPVINSTAVGITRHNKSKIKSLSILLLKYISIVMAKAYIGLKGLFKKTSSCILPLTKQEKRFSKAQPS